MATSALVWRPASPVSAAQGGGSAAEVTEPTRVSQRFFWRGVETVSAQQRPLPPAQLCSPLRAVHVALTLSGVASKPLLRPLPPTVAEVRRPSDVTVGDAWPGNHVTFVPSGGPPKAWGGRLCSYGIAHSLLERSSAAENARFDFFRPARQRHAHCKGRCNRDTPRIRAADCAVLGDMLRILATGRMCAVRIGCRSSCPTLVLKEHRSRVSSLTLPDRYSLA